MAWEGALKAAAAAQRREQRDEVRRLRDLERRAKEQAKLSAIEQARLEVEAYETRIDLLLSIHKEPLTEWSWPGLIAALDPCSPFDSSLSELNQKLIAYGEAHEVESHTLERCRADDREAFAQLLAAHASTREERRGHRELAARVICADLDAWAAAIAQLRPFEELEELGVTVTPDFHSRESVHCSITVGGPEVIPQEVKALTSTGKLSVKPMAKARFHEIYQDYVCGCVLRTARDMFGFLPVTVAFVTASVGFVDQATGRFAVRPVLSVGFPRKDFSRLVLDALDPSDALDGFVHRGDAKASRKTGSFVPVEPLRREDLAPSAHRTARFDDALKQLRRERDEIRLRADAHATRAPIVSSPEA